jgi:DNA adenine methylase
MRYCGGKARIAKHIAPVILRLASGRPIIEPFCGGLSMTIALSPILISDSSRPLVTLISAVRTGWTPPVLSETDYKRLRYDESDPVLRAYAGICCSWGGKWFGGYAKGHATNPRPQETTARTLLKRVGMTAHIPLLLSDYKNVEIPRGSLVYCDPPYINSTHAYPSESLFDHDEFWDWAKMISFSGSNVVVSERVAPDWASCVYERRTKLSLIGNDEAERLFLA